MVNETPENNFEYVLQMWRESSPEQRAQWRTLLVIFSGLWLAGAAAAFFTVAGIGQMKIGARLLAAGLMGPTGLVWFFLKATGTIEETMREPNLFWAALLIVSLGSIGLAGKILAGEPNHLVLQQRRQQASEKAQGRLSAGEAAEKLGVSQGVGLARPQTGKDQVMVGLDYAAGEGHVLVVGPTTSGKGLHLTQTLLTWPGAAIIVDPKGEQFERTAGERQKLFASPIYRLPGHRLRLASYYDELLDRDSLFELHNHLLRPWQSRERIFADKSRSLFTAAALYAQFHRLDPVRVLLDAAEGDPAEVLAGLESVPAARQHVRLFTDGLTPDKYHDNRFATSAYGTFTTMLSGYQKHVDTIAPDRSNSAVIPVDWAVRGATIYVTYSLSDLQSVGGVVAAVMAAFIRYQIRRRYKERLLVAIDELPAVGLHNVTNYLATAGGYGITLLLYAQAVSQLRELYRNDGTQSILANCAHQVWYPPADMETARVMSELYGTTYKPTLSQSISRRFYQGSDAQNGQARSYQDNRQARGWEVRPALEPSEMMSLPRDRVLVLTQKDRQYRFIGRRLNPVPQFSRLAPPPRLPDFQPGRRDYTRWAGRSQGRPAPGDGEDAPLAGTAHF